MKTTLSYKLLKSLKRGLMKIDGPALDKLTQYILSQQVEGAAFADKTGKTDLYYTAFGWSLLHALKLPLDVSAATAYLESFDVAQLDLVHLSAYHKCKRLLLLMSGVKMPLLLLKSRFGWQHTIDLPLSPSGTPYDLFLTYGLLEDAHQKMPDASVWMQALEHYQLETGGFSNIKKGFFFSTNATASALMVLGQVNGFKSNGQVTTLHEKQADCGGFYAVDEALMPDLLSTATALFVLGCYHYKPNEATADFIEAHWNEQSGGFSATLLEDSSDIEYTFYGILALGML